MGAKDLTAVRSRSGCAFARRRGPPQTVWVRLPARDSRSVWWIAWDIRGKSVAKTSLSTNLSASLGAAVCSHKRSLTIFGQMTLHGQFSTRSFSRPWAADAGPHSLTGILH